MIIEAAMCLALNMFFEARQEPIAGQLAVAAVTLNRVEDKRYPNNVCDVVWEKNQFSWTHDGKPDNPLQMSYLDVQAWHEIAELAEDVVSGEIELPGISSTHYHTTSVKPFWTKHYELDGRIGNHLFYTNETPYK